MRRQDYRQAPDRLGEHLGEPLSPRCTTGCSSEPIMRRVASAVASLMRIGSEEHKRRFCRQFIASHCHFDPVTLAWPDLDDAALGRLRGVPFWREVLYTERRAGATVAAYAQTIADPLVREAVTLQGFEEARHAELLRVMIQRYRISADEPPLDEPKGSDLRRAFADFGYGECLDSFLGFGVFKIARRSGFLPEPLFEIFDMLMREETRHIVFFINWMAWQQTARGYGARWLRAAIAAWYYSRAIGRLLGTLRRGRNANDGKDFSATRRASFSTDSHSAALSKNVAPNMQGAWRGSTPICCCLVCCRPLPVLS